MEWPRVKTLIIFVLLLINGFLLALVGTQQYQVSRYQHSALTHAVEVLEQRGISVDLQQLEQAPAPLTVEQTGSPAPMMERLLGGNITHTDQGGGVHLYHGSNGMAVFRSSGSCTVTFTPGQPSATPPQSHARQLLKQLKLETALWKEEPTANGVQLTFHQLWEELPIFSCPIVLEYDTEGRLLSLDGTLLLDASAQAVAEPTLDLPTALIRFWSGIVASGDVCSALTDFRPGYRMDTLLGTSVSLSPVWYVSTNTADYHLDALTGVLTRIS